MRIKKKWAAILLGLPLVFLITFFVVPFLSVVVTSLQSKQGVWSLANYQHLLSDAYYAKTLLLTFEISLWVVVITLLVGYPIAYFMTFIIRSRILRRLFYVIVVVPLFTSNIVRAFGWIVLLGRRGLINNILVGIGLVHRPVDILYTKTSIVIGLSYIMTPFMVLTIASVLQNIDRALHEASRDLGAGPLATFSKVTLPLSMPGVVTGSVIVFTLSVSAYVTPAILSGGKQVVMSMLVFEQYASVFNFPFGATLAVALLVSTLVLITAYLLFVERKAKPA